LRGLTGYFDQHKAVESAFTDGSNILRAQQDQRPFLAIRLAIQDKGYKVSVILLIAPSPGGLWWVHAPSLWLPGEKEALYNHIYERLSDNSAGSRTFIAWITDILSGQVRHLLEPEYVRQRHALLRNLTEKQDGPTVSLWQD
jgi:hypothetical protein